MFEALVSAIGAVPTAIIISLLALVAFYLLSEVCEDALAPALEGFSEAHGIPHDVACSLVVAFGSSAAEIAVNSAAAYNGQQRGLYLSTGALLGSALIAFTLIPALCTYVSPGGKLHLHIIPLARDVIFFSITLYLIVRFSWDENFDLEESAILFGLFVLYLLVIFGLIRFYGPAAVENPDTDVERPPSKESQYGTVPSSSGETLQVAALIPKQRGPVMRFLKWLKKFCPPFGRSENEVQQSYYRHILASMLYISVLSEVCLKLAISFSAVAGLSGHFAGLALVALATQVDDFASTMATARKGRGPGSISNALGSQVFDLTFGFGLPFLVFNLSRGYSVPAIRQDSTAFLVFIAVAVFVLCTAVGRLTLHWYHAMLLGSVYVSIVYGFYILTKKEPFDEDDY